MENALLSALCINQEGLHRIDWWKASSESGLRYLLVTTASVLEHPQFQDKMIGVLNVQIFLLILAVNIHLSQEHLETYYALLKSNDLEVQQISSLSLLSFLLEGNGEWIIKKSLSEKFEYKTCLEREFFSTLPLKNDKLIF